jgi:hypothetical protein
MRMMISMLQSRENQTEITHVNKLLFPLIISPTSLVFEDHIVIPSDISLAKRTVDVVVCLKL